MSEDAAEYREEVKVGRRFSSASDGRPHFLGEIVRFRSKHLGWYTAETSMDESRLERKDVNYSLYQCPGGYRVARSEVHSERRRERSRWYWKEVYTALLPTVDEEDAG